MSNSSTQSLSRSTSAFAFDLYRALSAQTGNLFFSPWSVATALAMAYAGARGETAAEMEHALRLGGDADDVHGAFAALADAVARIQEGGMVRLDTANSLWPHAAHPLLEEYVRLVAQHYDTTVTPLDYADGAGAARTINDWVARKTAGRITDLLSADLDPLTRLILVNAVYFKGKWEHPFAPDATTDAPFWIGKRENITVPTMWSVRSHPYARHKHVELLELPYVERGLSMLVLLPTERLGLRRLERDLTHATLTDWSARLRPRQVEVFLPRFRMEWKGELGPALSALGLKKAFDPQRADFSGIDGHRGSLVLSKVIHKAFVEVAEEGTEAAAATYVGATLSALVTEEPDPVPFRADHPFLIAIRERSTGTILFLGRVADPTR